MRRLSIFAPIQAFVAIASGWLPRCVVLACFAGMTIPTVSRAGSIMYASDWNDGTILKINSTGVVSVFVSGFTGPQGLAFDSSRNLYVAEVGSGSIKKITPTGTISTLASGLEFPEGLAI